MTNKKAILYMGLLILGVMPLFFMSCGSDSPMPILNRIEITSSKTGKLDLGQTTQLTASGFDQFNASIDISAMINWSASNTNVTIDQAGTVTGIAIGPVIVKATVDNVEGSIAITVWDSSAPRTEIYVSDIGNFEKGPWKILKYDEDGSNPEVFISSNVNQTQDIVFLEDQNVVLVSNYRSGVSTGSIARFNSNTGAFIDNFATGISGPTRIKIGPGNLLYVLQWEGNGRVLRYSLDGAFVGEFTTVGVKQAIGLDWDVDGNLYVSSFNDAHIRKFGPSGEDMGLFVTSNLQGPTNIWFDVTGNLLVNDWTAGNVKEFDADGNFIGIFISGLNQVEGAGFFENGDVLLGNGGDSSIKMYNKNGEFIKDLVPSGAGGLIRPNGITVRKVNF